MNLQIALKLLGRNQFALPSQLPQGRRGLCRGLVRTRKDSHETHEPLQSLCDARHTVLAGVSYLVVGVPVVFVVAAALAACVYEGSVVFLFGASSLATERRQTGLTLSSAGCPASADEGEGGRRLTERPTQRSGSTPYRAVPEL